jgi:hypothetical protein
MGTRNRVGIGLLYWPARAVFVNLLRSPESIPSLAGWYENPTCCTGSLAESIHRNRLVGSLNVYKYGRRLHWLAELVPWNRFLGSLNVYKYGLSLHWLAELVPWKQFLGSLNVYKYGLRYIG